MQTSTEVTNYLLAKPGAYVDYPFGPQVRVFKVAEKVFALFDPDQNPLRINLKCEPMQSLALRDLFDAIQPGYHMNKKHWNTITLDGSVPRGELMRLFDLSFELVVKGLPKARRIALRAD
ncbi:MmcQ/YjbR family DNA-binding protein [Aestuariirhabdus litorea]|uniref:MmcQ/YjbR family DNA-binding protein n=1 Tax=Aestuariirhabdus litorea TaxID=2528527 RepID=A0A3P3VL06_9GAMM|nr:MmcQ/YjbR family DNA-binding protein [Aestuariirhabdus litorea]RRJ83074.1 MmcQ/YjbR family DNA-binding protein [Aestuariirhabdus litorea]RWW93232.1 MmcQ/YjbR family DNA-binding protein [Endozoicomonadaceae bacterium GTF-13]